MTRALLAMVFLMMTSAFCMPTYAADAAQNAQPAVQKLAGKGQLDKTLGPVRKPHKVGAAEASSIARMFPDAKTAMKALKYYGREERRDFQPRSMCHVFEFTHDFTPPDEKVRVYDRSAPKGYYEKMVPSPLPKAYVRIEESTGRVLDYSGDDYACCRNIGRPRIPKEDLMSPEQAVRAAERYIHRAGLSMADMRLTTVFMSENTQFNCHNYALCWKRFVNKPGFGDVEYPMTIAATIDAQSGECDTLCCKDYPVVVQVSTPEVTKEHAEKLASEACNPDRAVLTVTNLMAYPGRYPDESLEPAFAWHVRFYAKDDPERLFSDAVIDAYTGRVLSSWHPPVHDDE